MIHATALVDPRAELDSSVSVGPWTVIGADVRIDAGTVIGPHVVLKGPTQIGKHNRIFQFASVGEDCQDLKYGGEPTELVIGDHNVIREGCTLHRGTVQDKGLTRIGNHNLLMINVHIAHDVVLGDYCILANDVGVAGHVEIGDYAFMGGKTGVHQFCKIGAHSMCGGASLILKDVPAYVMVSGNNAAAHGINAEGLRRRNFSKAAIQALTRAYKLVYRRGLTIDQAIAEIRTLDYDGPELDVFIQSLQSSTRGIVR